MSDVGIETGERCNRKMCNGVIAEHESDRCCSCHINPPCSFCTDDRHYCQSCDWNAGDERTEYINGYVVKVNKETGNYNSWKLRDLDPTKIDYHVKSHTHFSQICEGVYPEGTTRSEILEKVNGTFGGRFDSFGGGKFKFIAYTD